MIAIVAAAIALVNDRDVLFDLFNEHDHPDGPISHRNARRLRDAVKAVDRQRLVTISSTGTHLITPGGTVGQDEEQNVREEVGSGPDDVGVDILAPHLPRTADWAAATDSRVALGDRPFRAALAPNERALLKQLSDTIRALHPK